MNQFLAMDDYRKIKKFKKIEKGILEYNFILYFFWD
jgi:hypothetical protein